MTDWLGDNPFCLVIQTADGNHLIDLDEFHWMTTYADLMRRQGTWLLVPKGAMPLFTVVVNPGDQPYYTARHIGIAGGGGGNETVAYGIGKKAEDGTMTRLWAIPEAGIICGGDDVDSIGIRVLQAKGPRQ